MIDNESSYLSSLNNFILTLGVIIAFYEYFIRGKKFINSKISYTILALLIAFNLFLIASVIQFHRRMLTEKNNQEGKNYNIILIIKGLILVSIQLIITFVIVKDILS